MLLGVIHYSKISQPMRPRVGVRYHQVVRSIVNRMPKLQPSGLNVVHDIIPKGITRLHISQQWWMRVDISFLMFFWILVFDANSFSIHRPEAVDSYGVINEIFRFRWGRVPRKSDEYFSGFWFFFFDPRIAKIWHAPVWRQILQF